MKNKFAIVLVLILIILLIVTTVFDYIKSPITTNSFNKLNAVDYRIICYSEWESKVMHIPIYIRAFETMDSFVIFNVLNNRKINDESLLLCPSLDNLDSLLKIYKEFEIEVYKNNVTNVDEVSADYYYKLTKFNLDNCDSLHFTNNCFNLERIK